MASSLLHSESIRHRLALFARRGDGLIWLTCSAIGLSIALVLGLLLLVMANGLGYFWPAPAATVERATGAPLLGTISAHQDARHSPSGELLKTAQTQVKVGNRELYGFDFIWVPDEEIRSITHDAAAVQVERQEYGDFFGFLRRIEHKGAAIAEGAQAWASLHQHHGDTRTLAERSAAMQKHDIGAINARIQKEELRLRVLARRAAESGQPVDTAVEASIRAELADLQKRYESLRAEAAFLSEHAMEYAAVFQTVDGQEKAIPLAQIVRAFRPNEMTFLQKLGHYLGRAAEFVHGEPRESNTEGGVFPAIFGTAMMTILMSLMVTPFGVVAAFYLREYAKQGPVVRLVRIAINNLAGVPSIVFGVFGLGFFVYFIGGSIDRLFFADMLPTPTFGTGGILWASLTLALLTVPVVIVATEESIAAVPRGAREGSLALGASKFQTIVRIVLPASVPGILTGVILAMARGAGEVAPLMITGVVKLAAELPFDSSFPFMHLDRKFMHLGFHIYDVGFQ
ncbi:MAG: phosphate ABC transporter permease PstA, partial [Opitutaceae bacterium]|nr:phosphate ABC transporter permease PstA [Opitutaceae bacterium]